MYSKPNPVAALAATAAGGTVLGLSAGVTYSIIGGIVGLVLIGFAIIRATHRSGRR